MAYQWGVGSSQEATQELYDCVLKNYGKPKYWARYLSTVPNVSEGLTVSEIERLHNSGTRVMAIYNNFTESKGFRKGKVIAQNAVFHARRLDFPKETVLFARIDSSHGIDESWIRGYVEGMTSSGYVPGFYCDPLRGNFNDAFCKAVSKNEKVAKQSILWSAQPAPGVTRARKAPKYAPSKPSCKANVWGWEYGRNAQACPIETNLIKDRLFNLLW
ncbi:MULTISPECIES: glycoside hydrolase domain-containing protein [Pontibacillus]|uniref:DUF1906 domain-containing protein n=1 Tax=Pontibacillus chungwhensis TaxID=265426 RepID=A0ABY8UX81_9BACI|nr:MULTISPECIES: glycoside hydrolase domain-containing protein [Pontibacillus]MCD5325734.1 DUF1906 domain-containing protein [Pontibacillus sp. HN14]WIF98028.1 DUF1906 domain-containing protein [Pontibacillus chungwhensis]